MLHGLSPARLLASAIVICYVNAQAHWQYGHENEWPEKCILGRHQSPVNLQVDKSEVRMFNPFIFNQYDTKYRATLRNNGHSVQLKLKNSHTPPSVKGGGLPYEYVLDHLHFHWESEHTIHSNRYPLELHMVHYANKFNSTSAALGNEQGLAVIAVLFDLDTSDNDAFTKSLVGVLDKVKDIPDQEMELADAITVGDFLPEDQTGFFRYEGSLTTPACDESVVWTIFSDPSRISKQQLTEFQSVRSQEGPLPENFRTLQELHGRIITFRPGEKRSSSATVAVNSLLFLFAFLSFVLFN